MEERDRLYHAALWQKLALRLVPLSLLALPIGGAVGLGLKVVLAVVAAVSLGIFARYAFGGARGAIYGILGLLPGLNLLLLLAVNQRAVSKLRAVGVEVGFFGVAPKELNRLG